MRQLNLNKPPVKLTAALIGCVIGILGNVLAGRLQQYVVDKSFTLASVTSILALTAVGFLIGMWLEHRTIVMPIRKTIYWMLVIMITGTIVLTTALSWVYASLKPPTTYFLVDATDKMMPFFGEVRTQVSIATIPNAKVGLSIYGSNQNGGIECGSTKQLIEPNIYANPGTRLDSALSSIEPRGHGSLIDAVHNTLKDLNGHDEPIKLVVITSGMDLVCDPPIGSISKGLTGDVKSNISIVMISIGKLGSHESSTLENYASAFHGGYQNILTPAQLAQILQSVPNYGSQDYDYPYSQSTPTPTP